MVARPVMEANNNKASRFLWSLSNRGNLMGKDVGGMEGKRKHPVP